MGPRQTWKILRGCLKVQDSTVFIFIAIKDGMIHWKSWKIFPILQKLVGTLATEQLDVIH
jgi:hypothetical protein